MVFSTIRVMMKYSKGVETTTLQILYLKLSISFGMYRSRGLAEIAKSMQDFWKITINQISMLVLFNFLKHQQTNVFSIFWLKNAP